MKSLFIVMLAGIAAMAPAHAAFADQPDKVVYHVSEGNEQATRALRNIGNHLQVDPTAKITRVKDGAQALDFVFREGAYRERARGLPELILLDLQMPSVGGLDVLQTLRSDELTQCIPVVILTGSGEARDRIDAGQLGAAGYLVKPIRLDDLKEFWPR